MRNSQTLEGLRSGLHYGITRLKLPPQCLPPKCLPPQCLSPQCLSPQCLSPQCGLTEIPPEIFNLHQTLEILDLSGNPLSKLPEDFHRLQNLKIAFFSDCDFTVFPRQLAKCPSLEMVAFKSNRMTTIPEDALPAKLRWLILTNNLIEEIPKSIGKCDRLQKCMLAGNRLRSIPDEMANCKKLGLLRLSVNQITELPTWIFEEMPELSFLAFAGNPCAPSFEDNPVLDDIPWEELSVEKLLGEGASGIISKGLWKSKEGEKEVAIKLFKGEVTSDGSPADEMNACITAGSHPNLIDPIGKIQGHPEKKGLVLQLIPPHFTNLGLPPNFQTCTRDNFPAGMQISVEDCFGILRGIASVSKHLHARGISHGDLYAHNVLVDGGNALLGDFGAATIYCREHERAEAIERLEIRAFGYLIEDMMNLVEEDDGGALDGLRDLYCRCVQPVVKERPSFEEVIEALDI